MTYLVDLTDLADPNPNNGGGCCSVHASTPGEQVCACKAEVVYVYVNLDNIVPVLQAVQELAKFILKY